VSRDVFGVSFFYTIFLYPYSEFHQIQNRRSEDTFQADCLSLLSHVPASFLGSLRRLPPPFFSLVSVIPNSDTLILQTPNPLSSSFSAFVHRHLVQDADLCASSLFLSWLEACFRLECTFPSSAHAQCLTPASGRSPNCESFSFSPFHAFFVGVEPSFCLLAADRCPPFRPDRIFTFKEDEASSLLHRSSPELIRVTTAIPNPLPFFFLEHPPTWRFSHSVHA